MNGVAVGIFEGLAGLQDDVDRLAHREFSAALVQEPVQRLALDEFHHEELDAAFFVFGEVVHAHDPVVGELLANADLGVEAFLGLFTPEQRRQHDLEGAIRAEGAVLDLVYRAHAAKAEHLDDLEALGDDIAGPEQNGAVFALEVGREFPALFEEFREQR